MTGFVVAVDAGTSLIKAFLVSHSAGIICEASSPVPDDGEPGVSPTKFWATTANVISQLLEEHRDSELEGVVIAGQGDGLWGIDHNGEPAKRAYLWNSADAAQEIQTWDTLGLIDTHFQQFGTVLWPGSQAAIWRWLMNTSPDEALALSRVFCAKDFLNFCLTGVAVTDPTDASIPFFEAETGLYSQEAANRLGCEQIMSRLPPIVASGEVVGHVTQEAALLTGIPEGTPVFQGALDVVAMLWGSNLGSQGDILAVLGTTAISMTVTPRVSPGNEPAGATIFLPDDSQLRVMGSSSGTATLDWYLDQAGYTGSDRFAKFWSDVVSSPDGSEIFIPFLQGERAPVLAPHATGVFLGIDTKTDKGRMSRAVSEGISFSLRWGIESVLKQTNTPRVSSLVLTGGGSQAPAWITQVANVLDSSLLVDGRSDLGAKGVAKLVFARLGVTATYADGPQQSVHPDKAGPQVRERYSLFVSAIEALLPVWSAEGQRIKERERFR